MNVSTTEPAALVDAGLDERLRRDGFVSFPLLSPGSVSEVREIFGDLHGWEGQGFHADLTVPDPAYRRRVNQALGEALSKHVTDRFVDHQPFLYNFVCKFPGADSELYLHRDWMYVDERLGLRTYVAWVALEDIRGDNGRLRVLRGSHRIDRSLRGTDLGPPWLEHQEVIRARLRSLRVRAGDCVVFNNALLHCSYANLTDQPRLVAAVGMRPRSSPLVHFRRDDETTASRYEVDESFFCDRTPNDLIDAAPALPVAEVVPDNQVRLTARELAALLDHGVAAGQDRLVRKLAGVPADMARRAHAVPSPRRAMGTVTRRLHQAAVTRAHHAAR